MVSSKAQSSPWGLIPLKPHELMRGTFGPLRLWLRRAETDWFYAYEHSDEEGELAGLKRCDEAPEDVNWNRLGCENASRRMVLKPALPDRAVVVRPEMPFSILPGERLKFFVRIPLWIRLVTEDKVETVWFDLPTRVLSKTWFGSVEAGEAAYAMRTLAVRSLEEVDRDAGRIICPVRLRNQSPDVLRFDRICLRVQHLGIYQGMTSLWTNEAGLSYRGDNEWSRVAYARSHPPFDQAERQLADPRDPTRGAFSLRSIANGEFFT